jgi:hypothetical protein
MGFEVRPTIELTQIAAAGGGFRLDAAVRPTMDLIQIATAAAKSGAHVTFAGLQVRPTMDLIQIATAGKGCVVFEP